MALFDDRRFLLSHVRHSFVTCDDTGMCELAMLNEPRGDTASEQDPGLAVNDEGPTEMGQSYDIVSDMELIGAHRRRSNTAQRLERLKKERRQQAKLRHVVWRDPKDRPLTPSETDAFFPRKDPGRGVKGVSALARQLEQFPVAPNNPFNEYTRFDGKV